jgi:CRP-like cAMP-binding protein
MVISKNPKLEERQQQLRNYFLHFTPDADSSALNELIEAFEMDSFSKNQLILKQGDYSDNFYFICKGLVRIYYIKDEKEITNWFIKENMAFVPAFSLFTSRENIMNFIALEKTYVLKIKYSVMEKYLNTNLSLAILGRKQVELYFGIFMTRIFNVLYTNVDEKYLYFIKEHGDLLKRVPLRYIAAYLGFTQETLSRLRAKYRS